MANLEDYHCCNEAVRQTFIQHHFQKNFRHHNHCSDDSSCCCIKKPVLCIFDEFFEINPQKPCPIRKVCLLTPLNQQCN